MMNRDGQEITFNDQPIGFRVGDVLTISGVYKPLSWWKRLLNRCGFRFARVPQTFVISAISGCVFELGDVEPASIFNPPLRLQMLP